MSAPPFSSLPELHCLMATSPGDSSPSANPALSADDWARVESDPDFRELVHTKRGFILPATVFFIIYYFALPLLVGYWPEFMSRDVIGEINIAYLFALSQFGMAWVIMVMYVRRARTFDRLVENLVTRLRGVRR
jgi:uncharacterized membrane protein (DUF485 family)